MPESNVPPGFVVGTVNEPGYCEACHARLRVGSRAAIWHTTSQLFCISCANKVGRDKPDDFVTHFAIPLLLVCGLLLAVALEYAK